MHLTPSERGMKATSESRTVWSRCVSAPPSWVMVDGSKAGSLQPQSARFTCRNSRSSPDVEQVRPLAGRQEILNVDDQRRLGEDVHRVRVTRALQRLVRHVLERQQGLVDLGPWGPADQRRRRGEQLRDRVVEQDERQDGHNVGEHCCSLARSTDAFCSALSLISCDRSLSLRQPSLPH